MSDSIKGESLPNRIAVITSADGSEHSVSLRSAENVGAALRVNFACVQIFSFDANLESALRAWRPHVVFPVAHGAGETGALQALLDSMGLIYVGSDDESSAKCWNKAIANAVVADGIAHGAPDTVEVSRFSVPTFVVLRRGEDIVESLKRLCSRITSGDAVVVKPAREGSSVGICFCTLPDHGSLTDAEAILANTESIAQVRFDRIVQCVEGAFAFDSLVIVQRAIRGVEITVGILETPDVRALPVVEIVTPTGTWYDYEHKYSADGSRHVIPARLPDWVLKFAQDMACAVHRSLACRDYSRIDFIVENTVEGLVPQCLWFLEINTLPGFTSTSLFPDAAQAAAISMPNLVRRLVLQAWTRSNSSHQVN